MFKILVGLIVFFTIVLKNINRINTLKSSSLELVKKIKIEYEINEETLPVHYFIEFNKIEITNRMACLKNKESSACMYYCQVIANNTSSYNQNDLYKCYEYFNVPKSEYGLKKCKSIFPVIDFDTGVPYFECIKSNNVTYSLKEACSWIYYGKDDKKLACW